MRSIWSGTISFGLVSVAVRMFPATESKELRFHFLDRKDMTPIAYEKVRRDNRKPIDTDDIVRGFEIEKDSYVEIGDEDLDRLDIELTHSIDICDFVSLEEIDPIYYRKAYYLLPSQGAEKPYRLLVRALAQTGKVGIAKVAYRKELLDLIRAKAKGRKLPEPEAEEEDEVVDLMTALRESVERTKKQRKRSSTKKPA